MRPWKKIGRIFVAEGQRPWMYSHTACPVPLHISGDQYRIYFGTRDSENHPSIGFVVVDLKNPTDVIEISDKPALSRGEWGHFDDNGVYPGTVIENDGRLLMYYMGRVNGEGHIYYMSIGLAESDDGGVSFKRVFQSPLLDRSEYDPWMTSTPFVLKGGNIWHMWYLSGLGWVNPEKDHSIYHIKYAHSLDGIVWLREGRVAIELNDGESNIASPWVWKEEGLYNMVFCTYTYGNPNGYGYGLAFATSEDILCWQRSDSQQGFSYSYEGWDSHCMAYPSVLTHGNHRYLLYSGNGNGRDGFGIAVQDILK